MAECGENLQWEYYIIFYDLLYVKCVQAYLLI